MKKAKAFKNIALSVLLFTTTVNAAVSVDINGKQYQFNANPRLNEVLEPVALQSAWYWPAAALYQLDTREPELLRRQLLQQIAELKQYNAADADVVMTLQLLERQLLSWRLAKRVLLPIDYDLSRIKPEFNPRLDNGSYLLQLKHRPSRVHLFGAVRSTVTVPHRGGIAVADYLMSAEPTAFANTAEIALLQADGEVHIAGSAYWNREHIEAMPDAQIFIPLKNQLLNSQFEILNRRLLELAVHRVLP
jgi:hypothetical protein